MTTRSSWQISDNEAAERDREVARRFLSELQPLLGRPAPMVRRELEARRYSKSERARILLIVRRVAENDPVLRASIVEIDQRYGDAIDVTR